MPRIKVTNPVVELDGDEMARVLWATIKDTLLLPYLDVDIRYFDLGLPHRDAVDNTVVAEAAAAIQEHHVGIKCATITADEARLAEFGLKQMWPSPNIALRSALGGTIFREPIVIPRIPRLVPRWTRPIVIGRHAYGDKYRAVQRHFDGEGTLEMVFTPKDGGKPETIQVFDYPEGGGVGLAQYNTTKSITDFAHACFRYALLRKLPLFFSTKNTVLKVYDGHFKRIFETLYKAEYRPQFEEAGLTYEHRLIDDMVAYMIKSDGGYVLALKSKFCHHPPHILLSLTHTARLRRRRPVRHCCPGLWLARPHDFVSGYPRRPHDDDRSRARDGDKAFPTTPKGQRNIDQPCSVHFRLDARPDEARRA